VVVKWFIPEVDSAKAHQVLERYLQGIDTPVGDLQKNKIPYIVEPLTGTSSQVFYTDQRFLLC